MKTKTTIGMITLLVISAVTVSAQTGADAVWTQSVSVMSQSDRWVAGQTEITSETLSRNGDVDQMFSLLQTTTLGEEGLLVGMTPLSMPAGGPGGLMGGMSSVMAAPRDSAGVDPFAAEVEGRVRIVPLGRSRTIGGVRSEAYSISWEAPDGTMFDGDIWIAEDSGAPVRLEVSGDSPDGDVRLLEITTVYEHLGETSVPSRMVTTRMTMPYSDYFETDGTFEYIFRGFPGQEQ